MKSESSSAGKFDCENQTMGGRVYILNTGGDRLELWTLWAAPTFLFRCNRINTNVTYVSTSTLILPQMLLNWPLKLL